jgi:hypothetical protein
MSRLIIHEVPVDLIRERIKRQLNKTAEERFHDLLRLNRFALKMSGKKNLGAPQARGLLIRRVRRSDD